MLTRRRPPNSFGDALEIRDFSEYHTSLDNLSVMTPEGLAGAYTVLRTCLELLEANHAWRTTAMGEPQLGKRGPYPTISTPHGPRVVRDMMNMLTFADGTLDLAPLADRIGMYGLACRDLAKNLAAHGLMERVG